MADDQEYRRAKRRVKAIKGFYVHVFVFVLVMAILLVVDVVQVANGGVWWVQWPLLGWGAAIVVHAAVVFGLAGWMGPDWEEAKIKELMAKKPKP
jgi:fatty acid desaturase